MKLDERLQSILNTKKIPHLLIFYGSSFSLKKEMATLFIQELLQNKEEFHPDFHHYFPEGKLGLHTVQSMKEMCQDIFLTSYVGGYQCFLVHEADRMLPAASHALLKTFEEPPQKTVIILLTSNYSKILPTIISRGQSFYFDQKKHSSFFKEEISDLLTGQYSLEKIDQLALRLEKEDWDKKNKELEDLTAKQKQKYKQECEGQAAIAFQEQLKEIFLTIQEFHRDLFFYSLKPQQLFFPQHEKFYQEHVPHSLNQVQQWIEEAQLAIERGVKLSLSLEILFMRLLRIS